MARGRKRKTGARKNGRLVQPTQTEREASIKAVVLSQPHRKGSDDAMRECCVGRMIRDCWDEWWPDKHAQPQWSANDLYTAATRYAGAYAALQAVLSSERPFSNSTARGGEIDTVSAEKIKREWSAACLAIGGHDSLYRKAAEIVILDNQPPEWTPPFWVKRGTMMALTSLAEHYIGTKRRAA